MIKLALSLTEPYRVISRYDSAIDLPPEPADVPMPDRLDDESAEDYGKRLLAWSAPVREWLRPIRVARETGDYTPILKAGELPTVFVVRQISATEWVALENAMGRLEGNRAKFHLVCRYAVLRMEGAPAAANFAPEPDKAFPELGPILPTRWVDLFTGAEKILMEIAEIVVERRTASPN